MKPELLKRISKKLNESKANLTSLVVRDAIMAGWPIDIARSLSINVVGADLEITYPPKVAAAVDELEYGTRALSPMSVLRLFKKRHAEDIDKIIAGAMSEYFLSEGPLL